MTHESKIKALIEAGERAPQGKWSPVFSLRTGWVIGRISSHVAKPMSEDDGHDAVDCACRAANARDSIKLLAEIAEAATDVALGCRSLFGDEFHMKAVSDGQKEYFGRLRALLVKYKEAQDE